MRHLDAALNRLAEEPEVDRDIRGRPQAPFERCPHCLNELEDGPKADGTCPECNTELITMPARGA